MDRDDMMALDEKIRTEEPAVRIDRLRGGRFAAVAYYTINGTDYVITVGAGTTQTEALEDCERDIPEARKRARPETPTP